jgi:CHAD domain-containing protein
MLKKLDPELLPDEKDYQHLKSFYKTAGVLRDLHVQDKEMTKHEESLALDLSFIHDYIKEREKDAEANLRDAMKSFDKSLLDRYESKLANQLNKDELFNWYKKVVDYTFQQLKDMQNLIEDANTTQKLHKVRSRLKDVFYYMEIINSEDSLDNISDQEIKDAQSFLGDWHDNVVSFEFIKEFEKNNPQLAEKNTGTLEILRDYLIQKIHFN